MLKQNRNKQNVTKRNAAVQKFASLMLLLPSSTLLTWIPNIIIQIVILCNVSISPEIPLVIGLMTLTANLIIDPILITINFIK